MNARHGRTLSDQCVPEYSCRQYYISTVFVPTVKAETAAHVSGCAEAEGVLYAVLGFGGKRDCFNMRKFDIILRDLMEERALLSAPSLSLAIASANVSNFSREA